MKDNTTVKKCVLYDRDCIDCGECDFCDLNPLKICDNCGKCLHMEDCATIKIDGVFEQSQHSAHHCHDDYCDDDCCHDDYCDDDCGCGHNHGHNHGHKH